MKTFTAIFVILALTSATLAAGNCSASSCLLCSYNTDEKANYCDYCFNKGVTGDLKKSQCSGSPGIEGCLFERYTSETDKTLLCDDCSDGYRLASDNKKCVKCDGFLKSDDTCVECDFTKKFNDNGTCSDRTVTDDNCMIYSSGSDFNEMFVGLGALRIKNLFKKAREMKYVYT